MDPLRLHFGLGSSSQIDGITIKWPALDTLTNAPKIAYYEGPINVNQNFRIVEDIGFVGKKGDTNLDNSVNVIDVVNVVYAILENTIFPPNILWSADFDYTDDINVIDITMLINFILSQYE